MSIRRILNRIFGITTNPLPNVFAYYPLISNSNDEVGGYNGTDTSISYNGGATYHQNTADLTTSTSSNISIADADVFTLGNSDFGVAFGFNASSFPSTTTLMDKRNASVGTTREWLFYFTGAGASFRIRLFDQSTGGYRQMTISFGSGTVPSVSTSTNHYLIINYDASAGLSGFSVRMDGVDISNVDISVTDSGTFSAVTNGTDPVTIGKSALNTSNSWNGYLYEFLFNSELFTTDEMDYIDDRIANNLKILP